MVLRERYKLRELTSLHTERKQKRKNTEILGPAKLRNATPSHIQMVKGKIEKFIE